MGGGELLCVFSVQPITPPHSKGQLWCPGEGIVCCGHLNSFFALHCAGNIGLLVVDFDDTCTEKDTISVLLNAVVEANASAAAAAASASGNAAEAAQHRRQELSAMMKTLSGNYLQKQQLLLDSLLPSDSTPAAAAAGPAAAAAAAAVYDEQGLRGFCESLSDFDVAMNQIVFDAGALKGKVGGRKTAYHCTRRGVWREGEAPGGGGGGGGQGGERGGSRQVMKYLSCALTQEAGVAP